MVINKPKRILIAPLDWGLGHTTRCVPIIRYIQSLGHVPVVAGNASQRSFIEETFGNIDIIHLEGYNIRYSRLNKWAQIGLLSQVPGIVHAINNEHTWLLELVSKQKIDGIISDNRYGIYHPDIPSVIITHQLQIQTGMGAMADRMIQRIHYRFLERFNKIWIPDVAGTPNLSGKLAHTDHLPKQAHYIGLLARFDGVTLNNKIGTSLVVLLSGPEPQRSELSLLLWQQVKEHNGKVIFIEGSTNATAPDLIPAHISYHKRLTDKELGPILADASMIICRSGYSTLMDLAVTGKKAILIPTQGQTEQEYLGRHLHDAGLFYNTGQQGFSLKNSLNEATKFRYIHPVLNNYYELYQPIVEEWLRAL